MSTTIKNQIKTTLIKYSFNQHLICHHIVKKSAQGKEANFESYWSFCYTLVNPNKGVHPIAPSKKKTVFRSGLKIWIGALWLILPI